MGAIVEAQGRGAAGRGVGKVEPGLEKILDVELNFKNCICPAHSRLDVELKKLRSLCEAYVKSISEITKKLTSDQKDLDCAYAQHQLSIKKHR